MCKVSTPCCIEHTACRLFLCSANDFSVSLPCAFWCCEQLCGQCEREGERGHSPLGSSNFVHAGALRSSSSPSQCSPGSCVMALAELRSISGSERCHVGASCTLLRPPWGPGQSLAPGIPLGIGVHEGSGLLLRDLAAGVDGAPASSAGVRCLPLLYSATAAWSLTDSDLILVTMRARDVQEAGEAGTSSWCCRCNDTPAAPPALAHRAWSRSEGGACPSSGCLRSRVGVRSDDDLVVDAIDTTESPSSWARAANPDSLAFMRLCANLSSNSRRSRRPKRSSCSSISG